MTFRTGLCECCSNLWPSCCCAYQCDCWIIAQSKLIILTAANFSFDFLCPHYFVAPYPSPALSTTLLTLWHPKCILAKSNFIAVAQKTGLTAFWNVVITYIIVVPLFIIIAGATGVGYIVLIPILLIIIFNVVLRLHVARVYGITSPGACCEILQALFCTCCSTAQSKFICVTE